MPSPFSTITCSFFILHCLQCSMCCQAKFPSQRRAWMESRHDVCCPVQELLYDKQKLLDNGVSPPPSPNRCILHACSLPAVVLGNVCRALSDKACLHNSLMQPSRVGDKSATCFIHPLRWSVPWLGPLFCTVYAGDRWETEIAANLKAESLYRCEPAATGDMRLG